MATRTRFPHDCYETLGVGPGASSEEIRKAYRRLALRWHPDRNPGHPEAEERFKTISEAYAVLADPDRRRAHDTARRTGVPYEFRGSREDLFRDLLSNPGASAVFEELAREFERRGMHVDRRYFHHTLLGGRAVVTGGIFFVTPLSPALAILRLARDALRAVTREPLAPGAGALPPAGGLVGRLGHAVRWLWGSPPAPSVPAPAGGLDLSLPLAITRREAEQGGRRTVQVAGSAGTRELVVTVPRGTRAGTRLRMRGQGRTDGPRTGDLYLEIEVTDA